MRGTRPGDLGNRTNLRFIPAYAGNASGASKGMIMLSVHPRVCGERIRLPPFRSSRCGSSPRMRGTRPCKSTMRCMRRFIPAYAGNAAYPHHFAFVHPVHPRVCGERNHPSAFKRFSNGSSPRMRGTQKWLAIVRKAARFIPAYAGNAPQAMCSSVTVTVHPRVCGERYHVLDGLGLEGGSSPRMRGTHNEHQAAASHDRFIPAYAGNAVACRSSPAAMSVHPRVCGERVWVDFPVIRDVGSSPRMRGTRSGIDIDSRADRFIPAYAGNAAHSFARLLAKSVHPRVCGERALKRSCNCG